MLSLLLKDYVLNNPFAYRKIGDFISSQTKSKQYCWLAKDNHAVISQISLSLDTDAISKLCGKLINTCIDKLTL
jgi:hypothetical protein